MLGTFSNYVCLSCHRLNSIEGIQNFDKVVFAIYNVRTYFKQEITAQSELGAKKKKKKTGLNFSHQPLAVKLSKLTRMINKKLASAFHFTSLAH